MHIEGLGFLVTSRSAHLNAPGDNCVVFKRILAEILLLSC